MGVIYIALAVAAAGGSIEVGGQSSAAATATALAANGSNCSAGSYPLGVSAAGAAESCTAANATDPMVPADGTLNVTGAVTATATGTFSHVISTTAAIATVTGSLIGTASVATELGANGPNCEAGSYPLGVNASGAVESCTAANLTDGMTPADGTFNVDGQFVSSATATVTHLIMTSAALGDGGTRPTCGADYRGLLWNDQGSAGTADDVTLCSKNTASDTYAHMAIVGRAYGEMYQDPGSASPNTVALTGSGTYDVVDGFSTGLVSGVAFGSDTLTVSSGYGGLWLVQYSITFESAGANDVIEASVLRNDAMQTKCKAARQLINANKAGNLAAQCVLNLADGDTIKLGLENETDTDDAGVHHANVTMTRM